MTVLQARDKLRINPVMLVEITLANPGPVLYFADRNIAVGGVRYEDYFDGASFSDGITLRFKNDRYKGYGSLIELNGVYPFGGAAVSIKEIYMDDYGNQSEAEVVLKGILDAPHDIDRLSFSCGVSGMERKADFK